MNIVGFDFGTTNTVISRIEEGVVRNYFDSETGQPIPSVVCYDGVKKSLVGKLKNVSVPLAKEFMEILFDHLSLILTKIL